MSRYPTASAIEEMVDFFLPHCEDTSTLLELKAMAADSQLWCKGHDLFGRIRQKMLHAEKRENHLLQHQYSFEEICAKTLYNMAGPPAPFDCDSPFWVLPIAVQLAHALGIDDVCSVSRLLRP